MDPYAVPGTPPASAAPPSPERGRRPFGCLTAVGLFVVGFVGVALLLFRPAPTISSSPLGDAIVPPAGYLRLDDSESGGGRLDASRAAELLNRTSLPTFRDGVLRAWGRAPGEPSRAVVVLVLDLRSAADADAAREAYVAARRSLGATPFGTPEALRGNGFADIPDDAGRYAQRVAFTTGSRLWVVSVVTPAAETDHAEVVRLAVQQGANRPAPQAGAAFLERGSQALGPGDTGAVFTLRLANRGTRALPLAGVMVIADPALTVTVLGLTRCAHGCVGGGPLTTATERDARAGVDPSLRAVPPGGVLAVVLLVRAAARPEPGECAYVHALTFATDPPVSATMDGWVAAVSTATGDVPPDC